MSQARPVTKPMAAPTARDRDDVRVSRRAAYAAFGWVLAFLAWHVVWAFTGLRFPHHHWSGAARMIMLGFDVIIYVMVAVGIALPLALARPWGRRVPGVDAAAGGLDRLRTAQRTRNRGCRRRRGARDRVLSGAQRDDDRAGDGYRASLGLAVVREYGDRGALRRRRPDVRPCRSDVPARLPAPQKRRTLRALSQVGAGRSLE